MKITVDVYGVEQAMDFDTMETSSFAVLGVFGVSVRVPITEDQMEHFTKQALRFKNSAPAAPEEDDGVPFVDTRESLVGAPSPGAGAVVERDFSVMSGLGEGDVETDEGPPAGEIDPGISGFFEESEEQKANKLRNNARKARQGPAAAPRTVPRDEAGNPQVPQNPAANLPQIGSPVSDDDFAQG